MRSLAVTLALAAAATLLGGVAGWRMVKGDLGALTGVPPTTPGDRLYQNFQAAEVIKIQISTRAADAEFVKTSNGWEAVRPWRDRMDPAAAMGIIGFTLGMRVEDSAPVDDVPQAETGLTGEQMVAIRLEGADGRPLAKFRLGKRTPWLAAATEEGGERHHTVYVQPVDKHRKSHVFICSGDILPLFRNQLAFLRDHHPFFFHPALVREIRVRGTEGEMTLARDTPQSAWKISKPLELRTDPAAVARLIENLGKLAATSVADLPTAPTATQPAAEKQISLATFNSATVSTLEVRAPASAGSPDALATVSDRPGTLFTLPLKPEPNLVSLADIPSTVNDLRDPALTHLNIAGLHAVVILPATGQEIQLTRESEKLWSTRIDGAKCPANEIRLYELLTTMTQQRVTGFESDAATDFAPWGLDRPALRLAFIGQDGTSLTLRFGLDKRGRLYANRLGTPTVVRLDPALLSRVAVNAFEWRQARVWAINRVDLAKIERTVPGQPPLSLIYDFITESWTATAGEKDISDEVNPARANYMLGGVEAVDAARWLAPNDPNAIAALEKPSLTLALTVKQVNPQGEETGVITRRMEFAPQPGADPPQAYFGRLEGERYLFLIDRGTYERLAVDPLATR